MQGELAVRDELVARERHLTKVRPPGPAPAPSVPPCLTHPSCLRLQALARSRSCANRRHLRAQLERACFAVSYQTSAANRTIAIINEVRPCAPLPPAACCAALLPLVALTITQDCLATAIPTCLCRKQGPRCSLASATLCLVGTGALPGPWRRWRAAAPRSHAAAPHASCTLPSELVCSAAHSCSLLCCMLAFGPRFKACTHTWPGMFS